MTNRSKHVRSHRPLRYLDLSFEGRQLANTAGVNNGVRPHGGCRGRRKHPLSYLSHDKPVDYHKQLRHDIDQLLEDDILEVHGSPTWVGNASREITHSGESALIANKFLAASKVESPRIDSAGSSRRAKSAKSSNKYSAPPTREGIQYYRPNRTHQYLTTTDLRDCAQNETNLKYGRPTRTTLLRARQRSNSAPINAYEIRREMMRRAEERRTNNYTIHTPEMLHINTGTGETAHSWLIGARYNRARYVDAKSFNLYGMYMPRNNLVGTFVTHSVTNLLKEVEDGNFPATPPDTPRSDEDDSTSYTQRVASAPARRQLPGNSSPPSIRHAWGDPHNSGQGDQRGNETEKQNDGQCIEEVIDGLNIRGSRMSGSKGKLYSPKIEPEERSILPMVQGMSWRSPRRKVQCDTGPYQHPPPPTPLGHQSLKDFSENVKLEELIVKTSFSPKGPLSASSRSFVEPLKEGEAPTPKKTKPILVDRSVNCPSVAGDPDQIGDRVVDHSVEQTPGAEQEPEPELKRQPEAGTFPVPVVSADETCRTQMDHSEAEKASTMGNTSMEVRGESFIVSERGLDIEPAEKDSDKEATGPEIQLPISETDAGVNTIADPSFQNDVAFFMTEDGYKKENNDTEVVKNAAVSLHGSEETVSGETEKAVLQEIGNAVLPETEEAVLHVAEKTVKELPDDGNVTPNERIDLNKSDDEMTRTVSEIRGDDKDGQVNVYESYDDEYDDKDTAYNITVDICKKSDH